MAVKLVTIGQCGKRLLGPHRAGGLGHRAPCGGLRGGVLNWSPFLSLSLSPPVSGLVSAGNCRGWGNRMSVTADTTDCSHGQSCPAEPAHHHSPARSEGGGDWRGPGRDGEERGVGVLGLAPFHRVPWDSLCPSTFSHLELYPWGSCHSLSCLGQ